MSCDLDCQGRPDAERRVNFLLGIGCQKGGTSWLHRYLSSSPEVNLGFCKEYHIFDALYIDECRRFYEELVSRVKGASRLKRGTPAHQNDLLLYSFCNDPSQYFDYFRSLACSDTETKVVGDITPSYAGLPQEAFLLIRKSLLEQGLQPRVVFFMRDPFERCWSAVRMGRRSMRARGQPVRVPEEHQLLKYIRTEEARIRTRYDITIRNIRNFFPEEEIFVGFYERLFTQETVVHLCQFLDIAFVEPDFSKKVNQSEKTEAISESSIRKVALFFRDLYEWAFEHYGEAFIRKIWPGARFI